jgi:hypothetical protein
MLLFFISWTVEAQKTSASVVDRMKRFHQLMVTDRFYIDQYVDTALSYGHSNGWVENYKEFYTNLGQKLVYHSITEDSITASGNNKVTQIRFVGDFDVSLDGKRNLFRLKVLEIWTKRKGNWKLLARQAVR